MGLGGWHILRHPVTFLSTWQGFCTLRRQSGRRRSGNNPLISFGWFFTTSEVLLGSRLASSPSMYKTKTAPIQRGDVHLHGWDSQAESWHGPIPLSAGSRGARNILERIGTARKSFQGKLRCSVPGLPCIEFFTAVYDLRDTGLAIVNLDGEGDGPVGIVAVVPRTRRRLLRNDFAFGPSTSVGIDGSRLGAARWPAPGSKAWPRAAIYCVTPFRVSILTICRRRVDVALRAWHWEMRSDSYVTRRMHEHRVGLGN